MKVRRPTHREIMGKLASARDAVSRSQIGFVNVKATREDLLELNILVEDLPELLPRILDELRAEFYRGGYPPRESYASDIRGCELYAFAWGSKIIGCDMYFKFVLKREWLWVVSLHEDRKAKGSGSDELP
jgi:hypothetical protein